MGFQGEIGFSGGSPAGCYPPAVRIFWCFLTNGLKLRVVGADYPRDDSEGWEDFAGAIARYSSEL